MYALIDTTFEFAGYYAGVVIREFPFCSDAVRFAERRLRDTKELLDEGIEFRSGQRGVAEMSVVRLGEDWKPGRRLYVRFKDIEATAWSCSL